MAKIKGWKKLDEKEEDYKYRATYQHEKGLWLKIESVGQISARQKARRYFVTSWWGNYYMPSSPPSYLANFKTKEKAQAFAVRWMKAHPRG